MPIGVKGSRHNLLEISLVPDLVTEVFEFDWGKLGRPDKFDTFQVDGYILQHCSLFLLSIERRIRLLGSFQVLLDTRYGKGHLIHLSAFT